MSSAPSVPSRVRRQLEDGEVVIAVLAAERRGARSSRRIKSAGASFGAIGSAVAAKSAAKALKGVSIPAKSYLALTDRRLVVVSTSRFAGDREGGRPIAANRIQDAAVRGQQGGRVVGRIGLMAGNDLEFEVSAGKADDLSAFIGQVQATIARNAGAPKGARAWPPR